MNGRPYQLAAVDHVFQSFTEGKKTALIVAPTGTGKTITFALIIVRFATIYPSDQRVLVIAHREELIHQAADKIARVTGERPDIEMASARADLHMFRRSKVIVASKDTLQGKRLERFDPREFGLIITDECFVAGTLVDGRRIETIRAGELVNCFDHATNRVVRRRVVRLFKNPCRQLVRVTLSNGRRIVCTPGHPLFTDRGYVPALELQSTDSVYCNTHEHATANDDMPGVRSRVSGQESAGGERAVPRVLLAGVQAKMVGEARSQDSHNALCRMQIASGVQWQEGHGLGSGGTSLLLTSVPEQCETIYQFSDNGGNESQVRFGQNESQKSDAIATCQGGNDGEDEGQNIPCSWGQWSTDGSAGGIGHNALPANGTRNTHEARAGHIRIASRLLQSGHRRSDDQVGNRGGRENPPLEEVAVPRSSQDGGVERTWVDSVEVLERGSDGRFGEVCSDGYVYNIEVEGVHNYFANGVLVHNCHHAPASSYQTIYKHFAHALHVGVTATPDRHDEVALGKVYHDAEPFVYELPEAIKDGYLVPIKQHSVVVEGLDYSGVRTTAGDLNGRDLADVMNNEEVLQQIASATIADAGDKKTIVFAPPGFKKDGADCFRVSERLTEILNRHKPHSAKLVMGTTHTDERKAALADYAAGEFQFLVNVGVFTEGFDEPGIQLVVMARATKSRALYAQMIGRGTRPLPGLIDGLDSDEARRGAIAASAKPDLTVLDFEGNAGTHKLIHTGDVLGGDYDQEVVDLAQAMAKKAGKPTDMANALELAAEQIRRRSEFERLRRLHLVAKAQYSKREINPFDLVGVEPPRSRGWDHEQPPTEKQMATLAKFGIPTNGIHSKKQAGAILGKCIADVQAGKASYKQRALLAKFGHNGNYSFDEASALIERCIGEKKRKWVTA